MKQSRLLLIICAFALLFASCGRKIDRPGEVSAAFSVDIPRTKALGDASAATELEVRVYDAGGNHLFSQKAEPSDRGWNVELKLVPGTYSFSFWATSAQADAFSFDGQYMTLSYPLMDVNSDDEDAFWASVVNKEVSAPFVQNVTLKRPFALVQLTSGSLTGNSLDGATSALTVTGAVCTRMNLLGGDADQAVRKAIFTSAPVSGETDGDIPVAAYAYLLVPKEGITAAEVAYTISFAGGNTVSGSASDVPFAPNHRTILKDN